MTSPAPGPQPEVTRPGSGGAGILIVEDEPELVRALRINLRARQYDVRCASTGREALTVAADHPPDAIILDLGLPDIDGTEVIVELRRWYHAPIIVLSGRTSPGDKIGALDVGADDYVTKPFAMAELLARLRAVLRRDDGEGGGTGPGRVRQATIGRWLVDLAAHQVRRADTDDARDTLRLTPTEWRILEILLRRPGQLVGSAQLLTMVWGPGFGQRTNYLRFHMARLRRKLEDNPARPRHLLTEPGMGYRYQPLGGLHQERVQLAALGGSGSAERLGCRDSRIWYPVTNTVKMTTPETASAAAPAAALPADQAAAHRAAASKAADAVTHTPDLTPSTGRTGRTAAGPAEMSAVITASSAWVLDASA
jgi:two-component system, OmpR family, KDP operon response regulator KdpE